LRAFGLTLALLLFAGCGASHRPHYSDAPLTQRVGPRYSPVADAICDFGGDCRKGMSTIVILPAREDPIRRVSFSVNSTTVVDETKSFYITLVTPGYEAHVLEPASVIRVGERTFDVHARIFSRTHPRGRAVPSVRETNPRR